jgi:hypothetical protein
MNKILPASEAAVTGSHNAKSIAVSAAINSVTVQRSIRGSFRGVDLGGGKF